MASDNIELPEIDSGIHFECSVCSQEYNILPTKYKCINCNNDSLEEGKKKN